MMLAFGRMGIRPADFWRMTLAEWGAAAEGFMEGLGIEFFAGLTRDELDKLMKDFPDA